MRVFLIRHPRPTVAEGLCYGRTDVAALPGDAAALRARLPAGMPLFSSPLARCRTLAGDLHPAPVWDERLREMDFGDWEMRSWADIPRAELDAWAAAPLDYAPPGGESVASLRARVVSFIGERRAAGDDEFAAVTHAGVMKIFAAELRDLPESEWLGLRFDYGRLAVIEEAR